jgi:hypothetical protein
MHETSQAGHPADEIATVLSGTFFMGHGDKLDASAGKALGPGGAGRNGLSCRPRCRGR